MIIVYYILTIWAHFPILALTDDEGFIMGRDLKRMKLRFSLINILLGEVQIQFLSFLISGGQKKINWIRVVRMSEMVNFKISNEKIAELEQNYRDHYNSLDVIDAGIEKDALLRRLSDAKFRIDISYSKINVYTSITLVVVPIIIPFIDWSSVKDLSGLEIVVLSFLIYAIINLCFWLFQSIRVRGFPTSTFKSLKESENKSQEQNWQIYFDWQQSNKKADMFVSFVSYIQEWIIGILILLLVFFALHTTSRPPDIQTHSSNQVYTIQSDSIDETYSISAINWSQVQSELQKERYSKILILYNVGDFDHIKYVLRKYEHQESIWILDQSLNYNELKIILEE